MTKQTLIDADSGSQERFYAENRVEIAEYDSVKNHDIVRAGIAFGLLVIEIIVVWFVLMHAESQNFDRYKDILNLLSPAIFGFIGYYASQGKKQ